tara:strand:+ start:2203 stop:2961 length:759 start_codon:yes stop_codon:yes gene_type:complete
MHGKNKTICIAGKNRCAIECLSYVIKKYKNSQILALPNVSDHGLDGWQKSFKKFALKKKVTITSLKDLYKMKNLYFFSLEYEEILKVKKFVSKNLFNFHFSLLPKYRGCHTNYYQIRNGEKKTGVTLHEIEKGIDTGRIIDSLSFKININTTAYQNYLNLMDKSVNLFKKNINRILKNKFFTKKQNLKKGSYYDRKSVNYKKLINFNHLEHNIQTHNKIRSLIFHPFQLPIYNDKKITKSIFKNKKIKLVYL